MLSAMFDSITSDAASKLWWIGCEKDIILSDSLHQKISIPASIGDGIGFGDLSVLSGWSVVAFLIVAVVVVALYYFSKLFSKSLNKLKLWPFFLIIWGFGFLIYDIGMCTDSGVSLLTNVPMAAMHAFKMFILDNDISEIHAPFHQNWLYMCFYSLIHALAAVVSMLFVIRHFGFNTIARIKMWCARRKRKRNTYVFWGLNDATCHMINSINDHYRKIGEKDYRIILVRTNDEDENSDDLKTGINRIFDFLSLKNSEMDRLLDLECLTTSTYVNLNSVNVSAPTDILCADLKLKMLRDIIEKIGDGKLHMMFLSDDEKSNLHTVALLLNDITIRNLASGAVEKKNNADKKDGSNQSGKSQKAADVVFYCHARYNSVHRVIEDQNPCKGIKVKVVDSSHINVELLKQNKSLLPVNFVDVESDATVSSPFNALVIGFSEVGQDSVRFLYEFGAFVKSGSASGCVVRSDFHLDVVDKRMDDLAGIFVANAPAINPSLPFMNNGEERADAFITLHKMDCHSVEFYLRMEEWIKKLNYIVVATDDDELNISLGVRLFKLATRYRRDMDQLCILVRAHNDDDGHIRRIAQHYNKLWSAQEEAEKIRTVDKKAQQNKVRRDDYVEMPIYLFGFDKEVYTYENVIDDAIECKAIDFKEVYKASAEPVHPQKVQDAKKDCSKEPEKKKWVEEYDKVMRIGEDYYPAYSDVMKLRRVQGQDFANCFHELTKEELASKAIAKLGVSSFKWQELSRKEKTVTYNLKSGESVAPGIIRILDTLAQTEHLRWCASHEILGYQCKGSISDKDEIRLYHGCVTSWENLDEVTRSYDYNVVDVTLKIINPINPIKSDDGQGDNSGVD